MWGGARAARERKGLDMRERVWRETAALLQGSVLRIVPFKRFDGMISRPYTGI